VRTGVTYARDAVSFWRSSFQVPRTKTPPQPFNRQRKVFETFFAAQDVVRGGRPRGMETFIPLRVLALFGYGGRAAVFLDTTLAGSHFLRNELRPDIHGSLIPPLSGK